MLKKMINRLFPYCRIYSTLRSNISPLLRIRNQYYFSQSNNNDKIKKERVPKQGIKVDDNFKAESKQFYNQKIEKVIQLKKSQDINGIISGSKEFIVLYLYADWSEPCKTMIERLQKKIHEIQNTKLIKVNIDRCPEVAQALQLKVVPTTCLLYMNQPIEKMEGNSSQYELNKFFQMINKVKELNPEINKIVKVLQNAKELLIAQQKPQQAAEMLEKITFQNLGPELSSLKALLLARCYFLLKKFSKFRNQFAKAETFHTVITQSPNLQQLYNHLKLDIAKLDKQSKADPQITKLKNTIEKTSNNDQKLQLKFELVKYYRQKQMVENALEMAIEIVKEDKNWKQKKTNKLILQIFKQLGSSSPVVQKYRKIFQRILT